MKKRVLARLLSCVLCLSLFPAAYAETILTTENGDPKLEYIDPNPLPPPPDSVEDDPWEEEPLPVQNPFSDVQPGDFFYDAVLWAGEQGITGSGGSFGPYETCTRAETVTILWRAAGSPKPASASSPFTDVRPGDYYYDAVLWAVEQDITNGVSATAFSPGNTVNRGQAVTFLYRAVKAQGVSGDSAFTDVAPDAYYADSVQWAVSYGITIGTTPTTFSPDAGCTRAHIVTFLYRTLTQQ